MSRWVIIMSLTAVIAGTSSAAVVTKTIDYEQDGTKLKGFLAYDDSSKEKRPGVLVFPEWWGLNDYAKNRAKQLAELGYVAFAADLYGDGKIIDIAHPEDALKSVTTLRQNQKTWRARASAALEELKKQPNVDDSKLAAIGYCFGGSTALQLAYAGADLKAIATFHAALPAPTAEEAKNIKARIVVATGGDDKGITPQAVEAFQKAMDAAKVKARVNSYPGVVHSFTVPEADKVGNANMKYDKKADEDSWKNMKDLFKDTLGK
jgi:dienelactone hydrolase